MVMVISFMHSYKPYFCRLKLGCQANNQIIDVS